MTIARKVRRHLTSLKRTTRVPHAALYIAERFGKELSRQHRSTEKAAWDCISLAKAGWTVDSFASFA